MKQKLVNERYRTRFLHGHTHLFEGRKTKPASQYSLQLKATEQDWSQM